MIIIIAAVQIPGLGIGIRSTNKLLYHIKADLNRFKEFTMGHPMIMGRTTFESLPGVLPGRPHIIITRNPEYETKHQGGHVYVVHSLDEAIAQAKEFSDTVFITGGGEIYRQSINIADRLYLTEIQGDKTADVFFPGIPPKFKEYSREEHTTDKGTRYAYVNYERAA